MFGNRNNPPPPNRVPVPPRQQPKGAAPSRPIDMRLMRQPDNTYTFGNLVTVSPQDFPRSPDGTDLFILVNHRFVFSARPQDGWPPGHISLSDPQRTWASVAMTDPVVVQAFDPFSQNGGTTYLASMDVEIGFAARKTVEAPYDQDELQKHIVRVFGNQMFAPGQQFLTDVKSIPLKVQVRTVQLGDISREKESSAPTTSNPEARGILTQHTTINFFKDPRTPINLKASTRRPPASAIIQPDFKFENMGIGGLDNEFAEIFRRAFASRIFPPGLVERMGIPHVKGILLFGPPGTGKTLIARKIGQMLNAREPKVINGPEVLNKFVGQSEENVRNLFKDAEAEYKAKGDESGLHIIIFDELDAVCKQRGSGTGGGTGVGDSVVNQLLSKLDGVDQLNNILLIGMTNRMDMIDDALLRPGRLEVHVEISLPDEKGRVQIFNIHTQKMRVNNILDHDVDVLELAARTKNFSGAEIQGLVKSASSFTFNRHTKAGTMAGVSTNAADMKVNRQDFLNALEEVHSAFGVSEESLNDCLDEGLIEYSPTIGSILHTGSLYVAEARDDPSTRLLSVLFHGPPGSGKTALAAKIALNSEFPFIKLVSPNDMIGFGDMAKIQHLNKVFTDAYKSRASVIVLDSIERIIDWVPIGPRFSQTVLSALTVLITKKPPKDRRLLVLATTSKRSVFSQLDVLEIFNKEIAVPTVNRQEELAQILRQTRALNGEGDRAIAQLEAALASKDIGVGIKQVLGCIRTARQDTDQVESFVDQITTEIMRRS